jgi:hypothetical protein
VRAIIAVGFLSSALAVGQASAAATTDPFEAFQKLCAAGDAQAAPALSLADAEGWKTMPTTAVASLNLTDPAVRTWKDQTSEISLVVGGSQIAKSNPLLHVRVCLISATTTDQPGALARMAAWVGVARDPVESHQGYDAYAFVADAKGRRSISDYPRDEASRLMRGGQVRILTVDGSEAGLVAISYLVPKP